MVHLLIANGDDSKMTDIQKLVVGDLIKKVKETNKCLSSQHKELHAPVSRVGKVIEKVCFIIILNHCFKLILVIGPTLT